MPQRPRGRIVRAVGRGRGSGVIVGSRPLLPASVVPEELINQVILDQVNVCYICFFVICVVLIFTARCYA